METETTTVEANSTPKTKKEKKPKKDLGKNWYLSLIVIAMAVIPLIVRAYRYQSQLSDASWYATDNGIVDLYLYYKSLAIGLVAALMLCFLFSYRVFDKKNLQLSRRFLPLAIYALFIILSMLFSEYSYFSIHGLDEQFETVAVLLSYLIMAVFSYVFVTTEKDLKFVLRGWIAGILLLCIIGLFQLTEHPLFNTELGQKLIFGNKLEKYAFHTGATKRVYMTLYNSNYVGFFAVLVTPVLFCLTVFAKKLWKRSFFFVLNILCFLCLLASGAKNGMVALFVCLLLIPVAYRKQIKTHWKSMLLVYLAFAITFVTYNIANNGLVTDNLEKGFSITHSKNKLDAIETNQEKLVITYDGEKLFLTVSLNEEGEYVFDLKDEDGASIPIKAIQKPDYLDYKEENIDLSPFYQVADERFPFTLRAAMLGFFPGFYVGIEGHEWGFSNEILDDGYYYYTYYRRFAKIESAQTAIFTNYPSLASGRGYIWARTIPLLKDNLLLGTGPDTFTLAFPQTDYVDAYKAGFYKLIVTKPHNLYLQIAVQTGVLSLLAFLVFNAIYLIDSIRIYWKKKAECFMEYIGIAITFSILGYLISGLVNDSTVVIAPVYWCLIGIGYAVNRINKMSQNTMEHQTNN